MLWAMLQALIELLVICGAVSETHDKCQPYGMRHAFKIDQRQLYLLTSLMKKEFLKLRPLELSILHIQSKGIFSPIAQKFGHSQSLCSAGDTQLLVMILRDRFGCKAKRAQIVASVVKLTSYRTRLGVQIQSCNGVHQ